MMDILRITKNRSYTMYNAGIMTTFVPKTSCNLPWLVIKRFITAEKREQVIKTDP